MNCECKEPIDCCQECGEPAPEPVLPRCNNTLPDGTYTNATVIVEKGCITSIEKGKPPLYTPDICCDGNAPTAVVANNEPCDCPPGDDGENATITIGTVNTVNADQPARVENSGTQTNAVLNFYLPKGSQGDSGASSNGLTVDRAGFTVDNGAVTSLPVSWTPIGLVTAASTTEGVTLTADPVNQQTGELKLTIDAQAAINTLTDQYTQAIETLRQSFETRIAQLESKVGKLERV